MKSIRLFAYLNERKMYSISSQIFEGLTEYALRYSQKDHTSREEQKGPVGSGRILADIVSEQSGSTERRFLHDYAYTLFEEKLIQDGRVVEFNHTNVTEVYDQFDDRTFVKVSGRMVFNDVRQITKTVSEFNDMGEALAYVSSYGQLSLAASLIEQELQSTKNVARKNDLKQQLKKLSDPKALAQANDLYHNPIFTEKLAYMLRFGYGDEFEVQIPLPHGEDETVLFSASLDRAHFTESERMLVRKYSRKTESVFTLFGVVTQRGASSGEVRDPLAIRPESGPSEMEQAGAVRQAIHTLATGMADVEDTFTGRWGNEVIIDPIALYREL